MKVSGILTVASLCLARFTEAGLVFGFQESEIVKREDKNLKMTDEYALSKFKAISRKYDAAGICAVMSKEEDTFIINLVHKIEKDQSLDSFIAELGEASKKQGLRNSQDMNTQEVKQSDKKVLDKRIMTRILRALAKEVFTSVIGPRIIAIIFERREVTQYDPAQNEQWLAIMKTMARVRGNYQNCPQYRPVVLNEPRH